MKITNARITLVVDGEEKTFSEEELASIVKEHLAQNKVAISSEGKPIERPMHPTEGVPFEVNPSEIDRNLFQEKREDSRQEWTRQLILEAFTKMDEDPTRYGKPFKTLMPEKTYEGKPVSELIKLANKLGDHIADWVEQALEWAQRISNGETWEDICDNQDTANWRRLVKWKNDYYRLVGGSRKFSNNNPASYVSIDYFGSSDKFNITVPLVVLYK